MSVSGSDWVTKNNCTSLEKPKTTQMVLENKNILLISPEPWDHVFVSKHHYAVHLTRRGNRVCFLNPPSDCLKVTKTFIPNLSVVDYKGFVSGLRFLPRLLRKQIVTNVFHDIQKQVGLEFDVVWSFDNSVFYDLNVLPGAPKTICHIVDLNQDFQTARAARSASVCFCTTDLIRKRLLQYNSRVFKINHGFNDVGTSLNKRLAGNSNVKALYAGNLAMAYIDWVILANVIENHPDVDFVFLGPGADVLNQDSKNNASKRMVMSRSNVYLVGRVNSEELIAYYASADILLIAYQEERHRDQANPHKMMEYLGSGKVVVATHTMEYADLDERQLIAMSRSNSDFAEKFKQVRHNLIQWNGEDKQRERKALAMTNTYARQIDRIEMCLSDVD